MPGNPKKHPLHKRFEWNNTKAAHEYRLAQARQMIRVLVEYIPIDNESKEVRVFVSLKSDRTQEGGGYRTTTQVMSAATTRKQLLQDALDEMRYFEQKYAYLTELAKLWAASRQLRALYR